MRLANLGTSPGFASNTMLQLNSQLSQSAAIQSPEQLRTENAMLELFIALLIAAVILIAGAVWVRKRRSVSATNEFRRAGDNPSEPGPRSGTLPRMGDGGAGIGGVL
jgi:hypothetical protein